MTDKALHALLEWQALQHAPIPYWHSKRRHLGDPLTVEDMEWMANYQRWYFGTRINSMRGQDTSPMQRIADLERENARLREALETRTFDEFLRIAPFIEDNVPF